MKVKDLINQLSELQEDGEVYIAHHIENDEGEHIDTKYMEVEVAPWNEPEDGLYVLYPGDLVSG